jgi:hypothetical protein
MVMPIAGPAGTRPPVAVHLGGGYRLLMWLLLPFTMGVGTLALWWSARAWPRQLDHDGIVTRAGRRHLWRDLDQTTAVTVVQEGHGRITGRLDLVFRSGIVRIVPQSLREAGAVMDYVGAAVGRPVRAG